ncbi:hypothetical protein D9758_009343 [Tetrapyrgos nigripes]|uniref:Uncharacterized protein n=1 Tax=Tetrapyrgos nigripes TaxID=182062 RepID=A0A8H5GH02_9AGAR|nr:hypothetical protein D9758_009343 [Tetrapyrgos nigripes]
MDDYIFYGSTSQATWLASSCSLPPSTEEIPSVQSQISHLRSEPHQSPASPTGCQFCYSYRCMDDDKRCLEHNGPRLHWLWSCVDAAAPMEGDEWLQRSMWKSLIEMDDIWLMWENGDESQLPAAPSVPSFDSYSSVTGTIARRVNHHFAARCRSSVSLHLHTVQAADRHLELQLRLAIILWKSLVACRLQKYPSRTSLLDREVLALVDKWWLMVPHHMKGDLVSTAESKQSWRRFCSISGQQGHTCYQGHPQESMWKVWMMIQDILHRPVPYYLPDYPGGCRECLRRGELFSESSECIRPHVAALWCIAGEFTLNDQDGPCTPGFWGCSTYDSFDRDVDLANNVLNEFNLRELDEWLHKLAQASGNPGKKTTVHSVCALAPSDTHWQWIPSSCNWLIWLDQNDNELHQHWTETEFAISSITSSYRPDISFDPASWVCAVILFAIVKSDGFGPRAVSKFQFSVQQRRPIFREHLQNAPPVPETAAVQNFRSALRRTGHTCWLDTHCGQNTLADLYSSAYSMLVNASCVPVIGLQEYGTIRTGDSECSVCHNKRALLALSDVFEKDVSASAGISSSKALRRLIRRMNCRRARTFKGPLKHKDLKDLSSTLTSLAKALRVVWEAGTDDVLEVNEDDILLGFDNDGEDSEDLEEDEEDGQGHHASGNETPEMFQEISEDVDHTPTHGTVRAAKPPADTTPTYAAVSGLRASFSGPFTPHYDEIQPSAATSNGALTGSGDGLISFDEDQSSGLEVDRPGCPSIGSGNLESNRSRPAWETHVPSQSLVAPLNLVGSFRTFQDSFIPETGLSRKSGALLQQSKKPRIDRMRFEIKGKFLSILKSHNIDTGNKLPWRSLPNVLRERGYKLQNWPDGIPKPDTQNGIEKAPAS